MTDYQLNQHLSFDQLKLLLNYLKEDSTSTRVVNELEIQFGRESEGYFGEIGQGMFQKILQAMKEWDKVEKRSHTETLDINFQDESRQLRATIEGRTNIMNFCREDYTSLHGATVIEKTRIDHNKTFRESLRSHFGLTLNLKSETPASRDNPYFQDKTDTEASELQKTRLQKCKESLKTFRYKHRFSFHLEGGFRFDLTSVKSSQSGYRISKNSIIDTLQKKKTFVAARVLSQPETFEVELEFPPTLETSNFNTAYLKCLEYINFVLKIQQDTLIPTSQNASSKSTGVIKEYSDLATSVFSDKLRNKFIGPKPVSFELKHLHGSGSIKETAYTVTDKADGEGNLLFFNKKGEGYLIDSNLRVRDTGLKVPTLNDSILNGEYLNYQLKQGMKSTAFDFYVYDIYVYKGQDVAKLPLGKTAEELENIARQEDKSKKDKKSKKKDSDGLLSRIQFIEKAITQIGASKTSESFSLKVYAKTFYFVGNVGESDTTIFELSKNCWQKFETKVSPYIYDGLIYTPLSTTINADMLGKTWSENLKWKPPHENTVDFLTQIRKDEKKRPIMETRSEVDDEGVIKTFQYKTVDLFVGGTQRFQENACLPVRSQAYGKMKFIPESPPDGTAHEAKLVTEKGKIIANDDGSVVEDFTIVEFSYDINKKSWLPKRTRFDKTYAYHRGIKIQKKLYWLLTQWARNGSEGAPVIESLSVFKEWRELDRQLVQWMRPKVKKGPVPFDFKPMNGKLVGLSNRPYELTINVFLWLCYFLEGPHEKSSDEIKKWCEEKNNLRKNPTLKAYLQQNVNTIIRNFSFLPVGNMTANAITTANSVWKTIHMPITLEVMTTGKDIPPLEAEADVYYEVSTQERNTMQKLHNWIKKYYTLLNTRKVQGQVSHYRLIDFACGKGGDLLKWKDMAFMYQDSHPMNVLGVDVVMDNLDNPYNGACKRWNDMRSGDAGKTLETNLQVAFHQHDSSEPITKENVSEFKKNSYQMVSVQFALHYFFQTQETLHTFVDNVANAISLGGYFVGTCFDGGVIHMELARQPLLKGKTPDGTLLWSIEKKYNEEEAKAYASNGPESCGKTIEVFVSSINRKHQEYLVNWTYLTQLLAEKGIHPLTKDEASLLGINTYDVAKGFTSFKDLIRATDSNSTSTTNNPVIDKKDLKYGKYLIEHLTETEQQFSDKNVVFIYRAGKTQ